jgi:hypothetical protein
MYVHVLISWTHDEGVLSILGAFASREAAEDFIQTTALDATRCQITGYRVREGRMPAPQTQPLYLEDMYAMSISRAKAALANTKAKTKAAIETSKAATTETYKAALIKSHASVIRLKMAFQALPQRFKVKKPGINPDKLEEMMQWMDRNIDAATVARLRALHSARTGANNAIAKAKRSASRSLDRAKRVIGRG